MQLTSAQLRKLVATLDDDETDIVFELTGVVDNQPVPVGYQVRVFFWEWLAHLGFVSDAQKRYLLTIEAVIRICEVVAETLGRPPRRPPVPLWAAITDKRWFTLSSRGSQPERNDLKYLRIATAPADGLGVTHITCDLVALVLRKWALAARMGVSEDAQSATSTETAGAPPQPARAASPVAG